MQKILKNLQKNFQKFFRKFSNNYWEIFNNFLKKFAKNALFTIVVSKFNEARGKTQFAENF